MPGPITINQGFFFKIFFIIYLKPFGATDHEVVDDYPQLPWYLQTACLVSAANWAAFYAFHLDKVDEGWFCFLSCESLTDFFFLPGSP